MKRLPSRKCCKDLKILDGQHISKRQKSSPNSICDSVLRRAPTSYVGIENAGSNGQAALPIGFLCEQLPNVYVFSAHEIFRTFCDPFYNTIPQFKIMAMP